MFLHVALKIWFISSVNGMQKNNPFMYTVKKWSNILEKSFGESCEKSCQRRKIFQVCLAIFQHYA